MNNNIFKRVNRKESKIARMEFDSIIKELRQLLKYEYKFYIRINGSARYNCIITDSNGQYDLDYKLILTRNCKSANYPNSPTLIKNDFFKKLEIILKKRSFDKIKYSIQKSTSVLTIIRTDYNQRTFSYDICIIMENTGDSPKYSYIARNSQGNDLDGGNSYTWCILKNYHEAYDKFKYMHYLDKNKLIEEFILPSKQFNKKLPLNDPRKKTSENIFIEEVNKYK